MTVRVLLADDHEIFRQGLGKLLAELSGVEVVGYGKDGREAVELACKLQPDLVIMDVSMPGLNGIEAIGQIASEVAGVKVLCLSIHSGARYVIAALDAGAKGYLVKECAFDELETAIHYAAAGKTYLSPAVAGSVVEALRTRSSPDRPPASPLGAREREVLQLLAEGRSAREIAELLHLSTKTAHTHRQHIMKKLHIHTLADLVKYAIKEGLTSSEPVVS